MSPATPTYRVQFFTGEYIARQRAANAAGAILYVEQHLNASVNPAAGYSCAVVGSNASGKSVAFAKAYSARVAHEFGVPDKGVLNAKTTGRGNGNLVYTNMPAVLLEPLFASNPRHANFIRHRDGQDRLAECLVDIIREHFPQGGLIAFSIGHLGKPSAPDDRGAPVHGGGTEAEYAEKVLLIAERLLVGAEPVTCKCCGQPIITKSA